MGQDLSGKVVSRDGRQFRDRPCPGGQSSRRRRRSWRSSADPRSGCMPSRTASTRVRHSLSRPTSRDPARSSAWSPRHWRGNGRIDVLLANAGLYIPGNVVEGDADAWDTLLSVNVNSVFRMVRAVLPQMLDREAGDIIVTSSVSGHQAIQWEPVYSASKHAVQSFVHGLRRQVSAKNVRVGSVAPGMVLNELWGFSDPAAIEAGIAKREGLRSEDVAEAVLFMLTRPRQRHHPRPRHPAAEPGHLTPVKTFDYVIVGGGAAGCVLAHRLSEDPEVRVALVEAGPDRNARKTIVRMPLAMITFMAPALAFLGGPKFMSWFESEPEPGLQGRTIALPRGRGTGGSTNINGQIYMRGQREDFDHWRALGNAGWGYDDLPPLLQEDRALRTPGRPQSGAAHPVRRQAARVADRCQLSRHHGTAQRRATPQHQPDVRRLPRGRTEGRLSPEPGFQRRPPERHRHLHVHAAQRRAADRGRSLSRSGPPSAEPHGPQRPARHPPRDGGQARDRGRLAERSRRGRDPRPARSSCRRDPSSHRIS